MLNHGTIFGDFAVPFGQVASMLGTDPSQPLRLGERCRFLQSKASGVLLALILACADFEHVLCVYFEHVLCVVLSLSCV